MKSYRLYEVQIDRENDKGVFVSEQILNILHGGMVISSGFWKKKVSPIFSFELIGTARMIRYLFRIEGEYAEFFIQQLYSHYPGIVISEIQEYLSPDSTLFTQKISLSRSYYYPIKNFLDLSGKGEKEGIDSHSSITGILSKANSKEIFGIKIIASPIEDSRWKTDFHKLVELSFLPEFFKTHLHNHPFSPLYWIFYFLKGIFSLFRFLFHGKFHSDPQQYTPDEENRFLEKTQGVGYLVDFEIFTQETSEDVSKIFFRDMIHAFNIFALSPGNSFIFNGKPKQQKNSSEILKLTPPKKIVFSSRELAGCIHLPTLYVRTPGIQWVTSKALEPPSNLPFLSQESQNTPLGITNFRGSGIPFGIQPIDRLRHMYVIGKTGMGKSTLLENMIYSDILHGKGVGIIDPHGDLAQTILNCIPKHRTNDVILFDPSDQEFPIAFNMLGDAKSDLKPIIAGGLVSIFKRLFHESWGPRLEHILRNTIMTLLEVPDATLLSIPLLLTHKSYRHRVLTKIKDPLLKKFWESEFEAMSPTAQTEAAGPILNKVGQFLSYPLTRNILGQSRNPFSLRWIMDNKKIFIVNLSKGKIGEDTSMLLGSLLVTKFQIEAMTRADIPEKDRVDFSLYVDEFQNFATESFATILSEARKYRLSLVMANQYINQMNDTVRDAVFGNVGSIISFQVGHTDAAPLSELFNDDIVSTNDLLNLPKYHILLKLLVDGMPTPTFSATTFPSIVSQGVQYEQRSDVLLKVTREKYGKPRSQVEKKILEFNEKVMDDERKYREHIQSEREKKKTKNS